MSGRFIWIDYDDLEFVGDEDDLEELWRIHARLLAKRDAAPIDPVAAFIHATRDRLGDPEWATETIALGLRALGRPYPLADQRETLL